MKQARGFGLIEVLVALLVVSVGLLGIVALHARAQQAEVESFQRTQALVLLQDMANRINTNKRAVGCYDLGTGAVGVGLPLPSDCSAYGITETRALADRDLRAWAEALQGRAETADGSEAPPMIGARGCIVANASHDEFTITVAWQGFTPTVAPASDCGKNQYGDDKLRRAVSTTVRITDLQP